MVQGIGPDGKPVILMPTLANEPNLLTNYDREAMRIIQENVPNATIIPVGGRSAVTGDARFTDETMVDKDYGSHCLSDVLPYIIRDR